MSLVSNAVAIANKVTLSLGLQGTVTYEQFLTQDGRGKRVYAPGVVIRAVVEMKQRSIKTLSGETEISMASVLILDPTVVVTTDDRITLSNGQTCPVLTMEGVMDASSPNALLTQVYLG